MKNTIIIIFIIAFTSADVEAKIGLTMSGHSYLAKAKQQNYYQERKKTFNDLTFGIYNFGQKVKDTGLSKDTLNLVISDEEIKQAMAFGPKKKAVSIVMGAFGGFIIGAGIGGSIEGKGLDAIGGVIYGGGAGLILGSIVNYAIVYHLAKREAKMRLLELHNKSNPEGHRQLKTQLLFFCSRQKLKNLPQKSQFYAGIALRVNL